MQDLGLYIHIPFCERKCNYCDFYSLTKTDDVEERYINSLLYEIKSYKDICSKYIVDTIFIGGGTPSYLKPENIGRILDIIRENYNVSDTVEITMEANPNSISLEKAKLYKKYGINRISMGVQSLDNNILKLIGRLHNDEQVINAIRILKQTGFTNINTDVIFNIPGQNVANITDTLDRLIAEDIEHISFYSLIVEEGTPMFNMVKNHQVHLEDDDIEREMYYAGRELMRKKGYNQYEISNFCREGYECRHNIKYWTGGDYIGFGPFSHSYFEGKRYNNISDIKVYCENMQHPEKYRHLNEVLDEENRIFEFIMLRLRMNKGFTLNEFSGKFGKDFNKLYNEQVDKLLKYNLLDDNSFRNGQVRLTEKGMDVSNYVFEEFID